MPGLSDRVLYWANALSKQRASGLSAAEWCRNEGVSFNRFAGWRTRLNNGRARLALGWRRWRVAVWFYLVVLGMVS